METQERKMKYPSGFELAVHMTKKELEYHIRLMAALWNPKAIPLG